MIWIFAALTLFLAFGALCLSALWLDRKYPKPGNTVPQKLIEAQPVCTAGVHFWVTINVQAGPELTGGVKSTLVLRRCGLCGMHITPCHQGEWSLGDMSAKESELATLNAMYAPKGELR